MSDLSKAYEHVEIEKRWYPVWEEAGYFRADDESEAEPFCLMIPPPNVTGSLHIGHALTLTIEDVIVRTKRMQGYNTLWMPGTDHAGSPPRWSSNGSSRKRGSLDSTSVARGFLRRSGSGKVSSTRGSPSSFA